MSILILETMIPIMETNLGARIRQLREARGWDQKDLGERIGGRPKSWVSNLETGKKQNLPEPHELRQIARALEVSYTDLLQAAGYLEESDLATPPEDEMPVRDYVAKVRKIDWDYGEGRRGVFESILQTFLDQDRKKREGR